MITYTLFRPVSLTFGIINIYQNVDKIYDVTYWSLGTIIIGQITYWGLYILDIYWTYKIILGFIYHITHSTKQETSKDDDKPKNQ